MLLWLDVIKYLFVDTDKRQLQQNKHNAMITIMWKLLLRVVICNEIAGRWREVKVTTHRLSVSTLFMIALLKKKDTCLTWYRVSNV